MPKAMICAVISGVFLAACDIPEAADPPQQNSAPVGTAAPIRDTAVILNKEMFDNLPPNRHAELFELADKTAFSVCAAGRNPPPTPKLISSKKVPKGAGNYFVLRNYSCTG